VPGSFSWTDAAYDYVIADSGALRLVTGKGVVIWHDYGVLA
jgi:hypothetical protein